MAGWQVFRFDLRAAAGAVEFDNANPKRVRRKTERAGNEWRMNFARVAVVEKAAAFVVFARRADRVAAAIAEPLLAVEIEVQIFGDAEAVCLVRRHLHLLASQ